MCYDLQWIKTKWKPIVTYLTVVIISILYLVVGNRIASVNFSFGSAASLQYTADIIEIVNVEEESYTLSGTGTEMTSETVTFRARITSGRMKGSEIEAAQQIDSIVAVTPKRVEVGDSVVLSYESEYSVSEDGTAVPNGNYQWRFLQYHRSGILILTSVIFCICLLIFGKWQGFHTVVSLAFTCLAVFAVFVPSILSGQNIYIWAAITCVYIISMTLLIVVGPHKKSLCAAIGCIGGLCVTAGLSAILTIMMHLTGLTDEQTLYITMMDSAKIDLRALLFGAILVGAVGAVMDVSMSLSSSLYEVSEQMGERRSVRALFRSGMTIGRDIMGTMANTLILAYIGSSLSVVILLAASETSLLSLFNQEMIVEEVMQALTGSFGILFTIPVTSLVASVLYTRRRHPQKVSKQRA